MSKYSKVLSTHSQAELFFEHKPTTKTLIIGQVTVLPGFTESSLTAHLSMEEQQQKQKIS